jgi:2'-5' RNA ligase
MEQNLKAKQLLKLENNLFMPHVSLLYGDHSMQTREESTHKVILPNKVYNVTRLALVPSTSDPSEWGILHQAEIG